MSSLDTNDPDIFLLFSVMGSLSILYALAWFKGPNENAALVFQGLNIFAIAGLFGLLYYPDVPLPYSRNIREGRAIPYIALSLTAIFLLAKFSEVAFGASVLPIPGIGPTITKLVFPLLDSSGATSASLSWWDVFEYNALVASSEEGFKVVSINFAAIYLLKKGWGTGQLLGSTQAVWGAGVTYVAVWVYLHTFNAFQSTSAIVMAFFSGMILLGLVIYFGNIIPAILCHGIWNCLVSVSPYCLVGPANYCRPSLSLLSANVNGVPLNLDVVTIGFVVLTVILFLLSQKSLPKLSLPV